jgi:hypothetical protein
MGGFARTFFTLCISQLINTRFGTRILDSQNGYRAIRSDAAKSLGLKADKFDIETEEVIKCIKKKYRIKEVPSCELNREYGESGVSILKHGLGYFVTTVSNLI